MTDPIKDLSLVVPGEHLPTLAVLLNSPPRIKALLEQMIAVMQQPPSDEAGEQLETVYSALLAAVEEAGSAAQFLKPHADQIGKLPRMN